MHDELHKFPATPHLAWLGPASVRSDKIMSPGEAQEFLSHEIVVEEKVDGANLGLSFGPDDNLRFQNRGNWINGKLAGQWQRLREWSSGIEASLKAQLPARHVLFGEWCYARHSSAYDALPDWFLGFDVFDSHRAKFWSTSRRDALLRSVRIESVPRLAKGVFTLLELSPMLDEPSRFSSHSLVEGIYLRHENEEWLEQRCKLVRPSFQQAIDQHWSSLPIEANRRRKMPQALTCPLVTERCAQAQTGLAE